jgi:hypothetical protein
MSMGRGGLRICLLLAGCLALVVAGCGGGSSSSSTDGGSTAASSTQFPKTKKDRPIVTFGKEASAEEREAVNKVMVESLTARENGDFATQCKTLNATGLEEIPGAKDQSSCPAALKKFAEPLAATKKARKDRLSGSIAVFRVNGGSGYALFHGNDGKDYAWALKKEGGSWKLSAVNAIEL